MAAEEDAPAAPAAADPGDGGNAAAPSRSQRTRQAPAEGAAQQQPAEEEGNNFLPILNWIVFFFLLQNTMGPLVAKFMGPRDADNNIPGSPASLSNDEFVNADDVVAAVDGGGTKQKIQKPLGATDDKNKPWRSNANDNMNNNMNNNNMKMKKMKPACIWQMGTIMDLDVLITDSPYSPDGWPELTTPIDDDENSIAETGSKNKNKKGGTILGSWHQDDLVLGGDSDNGESSSSKKNGILAFFSGAGNQAMNHRNATLAIPMTPSIWNNETHLYAHVKLQRRRHYKDGSDSRRSKKPTGKDDALVKRVSLTRYRKRKKMRDVKSLLDAPAEDDVVPEHVDPNDRTVLTAASLDKTRDQLLLYVKPSLTLQVVDLAAIDFPTRESMPKQFTDHMDWYEDDKNVRGATLKQDFYYPILYNSEFWITYASLKEVNGTLKESTLDVNFEPVPMWKWQLQSQTEENWRKQEAFTGEEDQGNDMMRNMLLDTNPYLLAVTAVVSMLHTIFDILAFKNDISFFKNKKSMEGISLRSMIINAAFSLVILLYLADNETSFMVLMSNGMGLAIDVWKISKAITIKFEGGKIEWVEAQSYKKSKTKEYDEIATSHLLFVTMPLVAGYGVYSLFYQKHKGWYSWILNTLVGFIYMFGFVMMTPQLFINYKLQSVAHLNWRTMTYKSINTFIDDLFAFVIKMPIMHRLACLRDDLIFFISLYQRYKYRTDFTRVNEFGQCAEPTAEMLAEKEKEIAAAVEQTEQLGDDNTSNSTVRKRRGAREKKD